MAKTSLIVKNKKREQAKLRALEQGKKPKFSTRIRKRCQRCGRPRGYIGHFDLCRICVRELAGRGEIMGLKKSSW